MEFEISSPNNTVSTASGEVCGSSGNFTSSNLSLLPPLKKKKRNLPGMPDPNAEVIALSPKTLMATNRFVCEICSKGFQRDQNLQLHRRGHNLPWKLKQRTGSEIRKKVYLCPEESCVHHDPARALGDLTGIKKHYCRKHGEKKWKCERCSKKYAVQADWKAHMKTCGSREYKCDCGTMFSRRDSFVTHRAFCDALAVESSKSQKLGVPSNIVTETNQNLNLVASSPPPPPPLTPSATIISPVLSIHSPELPEHQLSVSQQTANATYTTTVTTTGQPSSSFSNVTPSMTAMTNIPQPSISLSNVTSSTTVFASIFAPSTSSSHTQTQPTSFSHLLPSMSQSSAYAIIEPTSLTLSSPSLYLSPNGFSLFPTTSDQDHQHHFTRLSSSSLQPAMSATALLQKAAQMGATASNGSFLRGLGLSMSSLPSELDNTQTSHNHWNSHVKLENRSTGLTDFMMGSTSLYESRPATLDLLGLGIGPSNASSNGLSAMLTTFGDDLDISASIGDGNSIGNGWEVQPDR